MFKCSYTNVAGQSYSTNGYYEMPKPEYLIRKADQATNLQIISNKVKQRSIRSERHLKVILAKSKIYIPPATYLSISCDLIISSGLVGCFL